jgi:hypothetical protein
MRKRIKNGLIGALLGISLVFAGGALAASDLFSASSRNAVLTKAEEASAVYTLTFSKNSSCSAYASSADVTLDGITWNVPGNQNIGTYVKIGGKPGSDGNIDTRVIYSKTPISSPVSKIVVSSSGKDSAITLNSLTAFGYSSADGAQKGGTDDLVFSKAVTTYASAMAFEDIQGSSNLYYRFEFSLKSTNSSNKGMIVNSISFYNTATTISGITISPSDDVTLSVGQSQTFTLDIQGYNLTDEEEATLAFSEGGDGLSLSSSSVKNGAAFTVEATKADVIDSLKATYGDITSNEITIMTQEAKTPASLAISGNLAKSSYIIGDAFDPTGLTATVTYNDDSTSDVTALVSWAPSTMSADTTSVDASYTENGITVSGGSVSVKVLAFISVDTEPKLSYNEGDKLDLSGMVVTKHFNDSTTEACTDYTTNLADGSELALTNKSLIVSLPGASDVTLPLTVEAYTAKQYKLITLDPGDLSGDYLIVYKESATAGRAFNCNDETNGYNAVTIDGNTLTGSLNADASTVTLAKFDTGYSIMLNGGNNAGKYLTSASTGLNLSQSEVAIGVSFGDGGAAIIGSSSGNTLRYNATSSQCRFRFYAAKNTTAKSVYLYRLIDEAAINEAQAWANTFLSSTEVPCADGGASNNFDKLSGDVWNGLSESYGELSANAKFEIRSASNLGEDTIAKAVARYDVIVGRYEAIDDFISRKAKTVSSAKGVFSTSNGDNGTAILLSSFLSLISLSTLVCVAIKKKKAER